MLLVDPTKFSVSEEFPGLYDESPLEHFLFFFPREFWLNVERQTNRYYNQDLAGRMDAKFRA
ncbi:Hypothetical protein PHPALM_3976 [Phytophthora palmivora]|uniref:Uncharacterized protein n=1 Tax=Phytophthora palmivora TaxID=4796 RepID=A0A2P4YL71_9STRA|nr:Hypothetical protein PHPALM_3976 [Phytophthora palmivora]